MYSNDSMLIFVQDPHPLVCEMISMLIRRQNPEVNILSVNSLKRLDRLIDKFDGVDYVFIEPQSSDFFGATGILHVSNRLPDTKIIALTDSEALFESLQDDTSLKVLHHIISKRNNIKTIASELKNIIASEKNKPIQPSGKLDIIKISKRQIQMLNFLEYGYTNSQIAEKLGIRENTVKVHFFRLYKLLNVNNRLQALNIAKANGYLSKPNY